MSSTKLEARILKLALMRGLLRPEDLDEDPTKGDGSSQNPTIASLVKAGRLDPQVVQTLAVELMESPLFLPPGEGDNPSDPEPHGDLKRTWHSYTELRPIGIGGGGMVYRARDPQLDRWVALKFPREDQPWKFAQMLGEARAQAKVDHPHVVKVYEVGEHEGQPFIAMQLVQGKTLREMRKRLTLEQKVRLIMQVAEGLHAAHQAGLIHLDLKPSNILVEITDQQEVWPYLTDFGLGCGAPMDGRATGMGTPPFASPEQTAGELEILDRRSDVYSLGATLYYLLVGLPPHDGMEPSVVTTRDAIPLRQRDGRMPQDLQAITAKCLRRNPSERYATARALAEDLQRFLNGEPVKARVITLRYRMYLWLRRNALIASLSGIAGLSLLGLGAWSYRSARLSAERVRLAERYGREVQAMEQVLRIAHMSRLHDRRPTVERLRKASQRIEADMKQLGSNAMGPGCFAIGEAHWALDEQDAARTWLDKAWERGFRTPACAQIRGLVLAQLYQKAKSQVRTQNAQERERILKEFERSLRDPALECFRLARSGSLDTLYQDAMEASLMGDPAKAIALAREAEVAEPWLYELDILQYRLHLELVDSLRAEGRTAEARRHLLEAGQALERTMDVAPSDPLTWEQRGWWCFMMSDVPEMPEREQSEWVERARKAFEVCNQVDPDYPEGYGGLAQYWRRRAEFALAHGEDPMPSFDRGVAFAEMAYQRTRPETVDTHLSWALIYRAKELINRGSNPKSDLERAVAGLKRAADHGGDDEVLTGLENAYLQLAYLALARNEDAIPYFKEAAHWAMESSEVGDRSPLRKANAYARQLDLVEEELSRNRPVSVPLEPLHQELERLSQLLPNESMVMLPLAVVHRAMARKAIADGRSGEADYLECIRILEGLVAREPTSFEVQQTLAESATFYGGWLVNHGKPAEGILKKGFEAVRVCRRLQALEPYPKSLEQDLNRYLEMARKRQRP